MGVIMQIQPYIEVYGDTANAVWQGFGFLTHAHAGAATGPEAEKKALWHMGRYENGYRKVDGVWKISKVHLKLIFQTPYNAENGWVSHPVVGTVQQQFRDLGLSITGFYDRPPTDYRPYNPKAETPGEAMPDPILPPPA
jgi:hypothetical protein